MSDTFTTSSSTGFFSRIKGAIFGTLVGIVLVPASICLLGWNEYRTIHRTRGLNEGADTVQTVTDPASARPELSESLVHMTGLADTQERLRDEVFGVEEQAIQLRRDVEMYQWVEKKDTKSRDKVGGGKTTETTYSYEKKWASGREDSERFHHSNGHENPPAEFEAFSVTAKDVNVGAYQLDNPLKNSINAFENVAWTDEVVASLPDDILIRCNIDNPYLYWSASGNSEPNSPQIGDQRIKVEVVRPTTVSLIAGVEASGSQLGDFTVSNGESMRKLYVGEFSAAECFDKMQGENNMWAWILRAIGFGVSFLGFTMILGVIGAFASIIPLFGSLTKTLTGIVAFLLAIVVTTLTIAFAWVAVRPLIAIPLIVVAIGAAVMAWRTSRKSAAANIAPPITPPIGAHAEAPVTLTADDVV